LLLKSEIRISKSETIFKPNPKFQIIFNPQTPLRGPFGIFVVIRLLGLGFGASNSIYSSFDELSRKILKTRKRKGIEKGMYRKLWGGLK
jgi:hypothetical protein